MFAASLTIAGCLALGQQVVIVQAGIAPPQAAPAPSPPTAAAPAPTAEYDVSETWDLADPAQRKQFVAEPPKPAAPAIAPSPTAAKGAAPAVAVAVPAVAPPAVVIKGLPGRAGGDNRPTITTLLADDAAGLRGELKADGPPTRAARQRPVALAGDAEVVIAYRWRKPAKPTAAVAGSLQFGVALEAGTGGPSVRWRRFVPTRGKTTWSATVSTPGAGGPPAGVTLPPDMPPEVAAQVMARMAGRGGQPAQSLDADDPAGVELAGELKLVFAGDKVRLSAREGAPGKLPAFRDLAPLTVKPVEWTTLALWAEQTRDKTPLDVLFTSVTVRRNAPPGVPVVETSRPGERLAARLAGVEGGRLTLGTSFTGKGAGALPLDEVAVVRMRPAPPLRVTSQGQPGDDKAAADPKAKPGPDGFADWKFTAGGLPATTAVEAVHVCAGPTVVASWSKASKGPLLVERADKSTDATGFLALAADAKPDAARPWTVVVDLADGRTLRGTLASSGVFRAKQRGKAAPAANTAKAAMPSPAGLLSQALSMGGPAAPKADPARPRVALALAGGDVLDGTLTGWTADAITIDGPLGEGLTVPVRRVQAVTVRPPSGAMLAEWAKLKGSPGAGDVALVASKEDAPITVAGDAGAALGVTHGRLLFRFEGRERPINLARLVGVVFGKREAVPPPKTLFHVLDLTDGTKLSGVWTTVTPAGLGVTLAGGGPTLTVPADRVRAIYTRNGKLVYLSDLDPAAADEGTYFGPPLPFKRDTDLKGRPMTLRGKPVGKGLAVHARSVLTYALTGAEKRFLATLAFDGSVPPVGRVAARVLADGKEVFRHDDLAADADPVPVDVPLVGAKALTLEVDIGPDDHAGDRVFWAEARVLR